VTLIGSVFYMIALALSFIAGFNDGMWIAIIISGFIMYLGWFCIRLPQIHSNTGYSTALKALPINTILYSILCSIPFFIGKLIG
jgi:hypothetical protein